MPPLPEPVSVEVSVPEASFTAAGVAPPAQTIDFQLDFQPFEPSQSQVNNPGIAQLGGRLATLAARVTDQLFPFQAQLFEYLRAGEANAVRFVQEPMNVLRDVLRVPDEVLAELRELQQGYPLPRGGAQ